MLKLRASIRSRAVAGSPVTGSPAIVALTSLVMLTATVPGGEPAGTDSLAVKLHVAPPARVPPLKLKLVVPESVPLPLQAMPAGGSIVALRPAGRASVKAMAVAALVESRLVIVNSRSTVPPGLAAAAENSLVSRIRLASTIRSSLALGNSIAVPPSILAWNFSVALT